VGRPVSFSVSLILIDVVVEELGDEVDVGQEHTPAAVPLKAELVQGLTTQRKWVMSHLL
jgi:hypothetical protein